MNKKEREKKRKKKENSKVVTFTHISYSTKNIIIYLNVIVHCSNRTTCWEFKLPYLQAISDKIQSLPL